MTRVVLPSCARQRAPLSRFLCLALRVALGIFGAAPASFAQSSPPRPAATPPDGAATPPDGAATPPDGDSENEESKLVQNILAAEDDADDLAWLYSRADEYAPSNLTDRPVPAPGLPERGGGSPRTWDPR